ncbi:hypothetical protein GCM10022270_13080 [Terriglobus aquaticus]
MPILEALHVQIERLAGRRDLLQILTGAVHLVRALQVSGGDIGGCALAAGERDTQREGEKGKSEQTHRIRIARRGSGILAAKRQRTAEIAGGAGRPSRIRT